jgi:hypothetical protein
MDRELVEWLRNEAHKLVQLARTLSDTAAAAALEGLALEMLSRAQKIEKFNRQ